MKTTKRKGFIHAEGATQCSSSCQESKKSSPGREKRAAFTQLFLPHRRGEVDAVCEQSEHYSVGRGCRPVRGKKVAFTLAEVLITLGIIGVVAAITIPKLISNYQKIVFANKLKVTYSRIMTAQRAIENEIGTPDGWETTIYGSVATDADRQYVDDKYNQNIFDLYVKYLNASDITPSSGYVSGEYYKQAKFLNGEKQGNSAVSEPWSLFARVMQLKDGTIIQLIFTNLAGGVVWSAYPHLAVFVIDINGLSGPNVVGKDIFLLMLDKKINNALAPLSGRLNGGDTTCDKTSKGYACLKRVIDDGWKITYY